jgi:hypothetical protein
MRVTEVLDDFARQHIVSVSRDQHGACIVPRFPIRIVPPPKPRIEPVPAVVPVVKQYRGDS